MFEWIKVEKDYLYFLRVEEPRIPNSEYYDVRGRELLKSFFSPLFELDNLVYFTQVSHRLDYKNLETVAKTYLKDWSKNQEITIN